MHEPSIISGGFFIARILERPPGLGDATLPDRILTLSSCLTEFFPDTWAIRWVTCSDAERIASAAKLGIAECAVSEVVRYATDAFDEEKLRWPCVWRSLDAARAAAETFGLSRDVFAFLELGVPADDMGSLLDALAPGPSQGPTGIYASLREGRPLHELGTVAGWELLGVEHAGDFHSWLCNSLQDEAARQLGILPGAFGLLQSEKDARAVAALIASGVGAESVPWFVAQIMRHSPSE